MGEKSHTPGPWRSEKSSFGDFWVRRDDSVGQMIREGTIDGDDAVVLVSGSRHVFKRAGDETVHRNVHAPEAEANARLIAASPELLAACRWAESALAPFSKEPAEKSGISLLRAAIAKATGADQ